MGRVIKLSHNTAYPACIPIPRGDAVRRTRIVLYWLCGAMAVTILAGRADWPCWPAGLSLHPEQTSKLPTPTSKAMTQTHWRKTNLAQRSPLTLSHSSLSTVLLVMRRSDRRGVSFLLSRTRLPQPPTLPSGARLPRRSDPGGCPHPTVLAPIPPRSAPSWPGSMALCRTVAGSGIQAT